MRVIVIVLLALIAHFSLTALVPGAKSLFYWPFSADTKPTLAFFEQYDGILKPLLSVIAGACMVGAVLSLFGAVIPAEWWPVLVTVGALAAILLYGLYFSLFSLLPIALSLVVLWGAVIQKWTVAGLNT
ncbi:MAG: hypothetical protein K8L99_26800 [Anaerolineae bacterium]|nr:hypothetical protein [Anaerolineae bacterium]